MKIGKRCLCLLLAGIIIAISSGCSKSAYGEEYNYETDCQYSYYSNTCFIKRVQSDGDGQYILNNNYIYYYNTEKKTLTPLCNKPNCLHDMETDEDRLGDCNAYGRVDFGPGFIQYYDGYVYYLTTLDSNNFSTGSTLYRVKKDGSQKDKVFTADDGVDVDNWLLHRGYLYYTTISSSYGDSQVKEDRKLKAVELSSNMSEKDAKIIEESDDEHTVLNLTNLRAYKNYLVYDMDFANQKDFVIPNDYDPESGILKSAPYIYNTETGQKSEITVPEGLGDTIGVGEIAFLKDKMLLALYDKNGSYTSKMPIYSVNYDLTDAKLWLDGVEQAKFVQTYNDYVFISDGSLQDDLLYSSAMVSDGDVQVDRSGWCTNIEIYSADGERVSYFAYPILNSFGRFNGFGPDGVNVEIKKDENSWSVYEFNFNDVLDCHGEKIELDLVSTRRFGTLNKEDY